MKKILGLAIAAIMVIAITGIGSWAYFNDIETSSGNAFSAGTLNLKTSNDASTFTDGVTATWTGTDMAPGASSSPVTGTVTLKNTGTLGQHLEIKFANTATDATTGAEILLPVGTYANGTATSAGTTTTLNCSSLAATSSWVGKVLFIGYGTDAGAGRLITASSSGSLTVASAFSSATDTTSQFAICDTMGTATSGSTTTLVDATYLTQADDYWNGKTLYIVSGTGIGQSAVISDFVSSTHTLTFATVTTAIASGSVYVIADPQVTDLSKYLRVSTLTYGGSSIVSSYTQSNGSFLSLYDLAQTKYSTTSVPGASGASTTALVLSLYLDSTALNGLQGDSVTTTVTFGLFQDSSQTLP